jgi:hypothetical protein
VGTTNKKVSEAFARPARTAIQATPAWIITEFVDAWFYDMNDRQFGVLVLLLTTLFAWGQAAIENAKGAGFLRSVPPTKVAVTDSTPQHRA